MKNIYFIILSILFCFIFNSVNAQKNANPDLESTVKFVSFPDFPNFDIPEPWPKYDTAIDFFFTEVKKENPDFVMVDGDLVNGHWWDSPECVEQMGTIYFSGFVRRMEKYGFRYYTAVGDHELGDDPWPKNKIDLIPHFENVYKSILKMPLNGPDNKKGLAYYVREGDLLLITVETFEVVGDSMHVDVMGQQMEWLKKVLADNSDAKFKIVQGHAGLWGNINSRSSSRLMFGDKKESKFYSVLKENGVDAYLVGEFHDVTVLESDGIWQIVHGSSWGRKVVNTEDYLVGEVVRDELRLTLKRIYMDAEGDYMWNLNKNRGPREIVRINEKSLKNGPEITGTLTITNNNGKKSYSNQSGYFKLED